MNNTKTQMVNVTINDVVFTIDIDAAIKAGIATPVRTHKIGNYYRNIKTGNIYILMSYGGFTRVSLVPLMGSMAGYRELADVRVANINKITEAEFAYMSYDEGYELIDNPLIK